MSEKQKTLLNYKETLLKELKYYEARIQQASLNANRTSYHEDSDSSDSEVDLPLPLVKTLSVAQLKVEQAMLKTCLQATQELTNLQVLQSQVDVMVEEPTFDGKPVSKPGVWYDVAADCRVDLVAFTVTFYMHQSEDLFGAPSYRGLSVKPVKDAHGMELSKSVLKDVSMPADAVEILRGYSAAHRSRRTSLSRLADKFPGVLSMEPLPDGGYVLKCADLLEVSWTLQNKWSPMAPFHHRLKFEVEYMDEAYIKIITEAHRELSDPSIDTDERTFLLSKIINTCLEAKGPTQELYDSMSSDPETAQSLRKRRTTLDKEPEVPQSRHKKDSEVMAPPKTLPKKAKPKGKENMAANRKAKKSVDDMENKAKIAKVSDEFERRSDASNKNDARDVNVAVGNKNNEVKRVSNKIVADANKNAKIPTEPAFINDMVNKIEAQTNSLKKKNVADRENIFTNAEKSDNKIKAKSVDNAKKEKQSEVVAENTNAVKNVDKQSAKDKISIGTKKSNPYKKTTENASVKTKADIANLAKTKPDIANPAKTKPENANQAKTHSNITDQAKIVTEEIQKADKNTNNSKNTEENNKMASVASQKTKTTIKSDKTKKTSKNIINSESEPTKTIGNKTEKIKPTNTDANTKQNTENAKFIKKHINEQNKEAKSKISNENNEKINKNANIKTKENTKITKQKTVSNKENKQISNHNDKNTNSATKKDGIVEKVVEKNKNVASLKRKSNIIDKDAKIDVATAKKSKITNFDDKLKDKKLIKNIQNEKLNTNNVQSKPKINSNNIKNTMKSGNANRYLNVKNVEKSTKIPMKKLSPVSEALLKKNPLRISPRKLPTKFKKSVEDKNKVLTKTTSIPRFMKMSTKKT